jgi:long-chain acyl-CoA synthetase
MTNVADLLSRAPAQAEAIVCGGERLTYRELAASAAGFAAELRGARRVAVLMRNSVDMAIALWAGWACGACVVPLNPDYTSAELDPILADAAPDVVVTEATVGGRRWEGQALLPVPAELASLQYTGGTTGRAKGVELTHAAIVANIFQRDAVLPVRGDDRLLSVAPLYHGAARLRRRWRLPGADGTL